MKRIISIALVLALLFAAFPFAYADDMTTRIEHLAPALSSGEGAQSVFNLNGQRVSQPRKGLYLVNGKKVIINK